MHDAIIIGGGPAGSTAAICLAEGGARVLLLEEKRMPREKLCGEFVTPESFPTLERLGLMQRMLAAGANKIGRVRLVVSSEKTLETHISKISNNAVWAMSLSRGRFDQILFDRAREAGAECLDGVVVKGCLFDDGAPNGVEALSLSKGETLNFYAPLIIDASGRNSRLMMEKGERAAGRRRSRLFALQAHFNGIQGIDEQLELYFFKQGYGGLSMIEDGLANLCFIVDERTLKNAGGEPAKVVEQTVMNNSLARKRLQGAEVVGKWHSTGPLTFGRRRLVRRGIIAIGDASGMIDPFTGTGIQMALRTGEMVAEAIFEAAGSTFQNRAAYEKNRPTERTIVDRVLASYAPRYKREFNSRLKVAGLLRLAAFSPRTATIVASILARMPALASVLLRATRRSQQ